MGGTFVAGSQDRADGNLNCLKSDVDKSRMISLLTQIAESRFAPISDKGDPVAEVISKYNVGGLVQKEKGTVVGLTPDAWGEHKLGLVPSAQSIRLVIAKVLVEKADVKSSRWKTIFW